MLNPQDHIVRDFIRVYGMGSLLWTMLVELRSMKDPADYVLTLIRNLEVAYANYTDRHRGE